MKDVLKLERHLNVEATETGAIEKLACSSGLSKQVIKRAMQNGAVWFERDASVRRLRRADKKLKVGDKLHLYYDEGVQSMVPPAAELVADEGAYTIWNKPSGMFSQGSKWGDHCTINRWAETRLQPQRPAFIVHRLDRAASGLIIIAHAKKTAAKLSDLFQKRAINKEYQVKVKGRFPQDSLPLRIDAEIEGRTALSWVREVSYDESSDSSSLRVRIETGRKHQIRKHLAGLGYPVVGDRLHGEEESDPQQDLQLTCCYLGFNCPVQGVDKEFELTDC